MRTLATAAAIAPALMTPAHAHAPDGAAFVDAFRTACVPQRSSYEATRSLVRTLGWQEMDPQAHAELRQVNAIADEAISKKTAEGWTLTRSAYDGLVRGKPHYLVLTRVEAPDIITLIGCSLYDFDATEAIDPQIVTDFIGSPIARTHTYAGLVAHSWDPPPALPGTFETNLTFVAEDSVTIDLTGFSGLVLKFDTSEPDPAAAARRATE